ncbi:MAG: phage tail tape measure protein [Ignavibacteriaceae bacterium]
MAQAGSLWVKLGLRDKEFNSKLTKAQAKTKTFTSQVGKLGAALGAGLGIIAVVNLTKKIVTLQAEFSSMLSRVNALTNATSEMSAALRIQAQVLGRETQFTATQAAEAMTFLAQAGLNVNEIYTAMPNTLELAAVGQISLAEAADISTNVMSAYGLQAEDLGRVNDIIANTSTKANTNVREFAEAFKMVGPVAKSAKQKLVDISAQIGLLANAGIKGTMAGTALRTMISKLINPTGDAADILEDFNIQTQNLAGDGIRPLNDILSEMREKGVGLKEMFEIFDLRAAGSADVLKALSGDFEEFAETVGVSGTAARVAAEQMDNLKGDLLRVTSAWEGALLSLGQSNDGFMRSVAQAAAGVLNWITPQEKLSETLMKTRIQLNAEIDALKSGNITGDARVGLIDEINRKYKDYLPNLITETASIEDLNKLQAKANELLFDRIKLRAQEEILAEELEKVFVIEKKLKLEAIKLEKMRNTEISKYATSLAGMQTPLEAHNLATGIQSGKVEKLVGNLQEAKTAFEELKSSMTFTTDVPTDAPSGGGGGGGGGGDTDVLLEQLKAIEEEAAALDEVIDEITQPWEFGEVTESIADQYFPIIDEMIEKNDEVRRSFVSIEAASKVAFATMLENSKAWAEGLAEATARSGAGLAEFGNELRRAIKESIALYLSQAVAAMVTGAIRDTALASGPFGFLLAPLAAAGAAALANSAFDALIPSFQTGTDFVPFTGMAQLHRGEAVIPASENRAGRNIHITGELVARGDDLVFIFDEEMRKIGNTQ